MTIGNIPPRSGNNWETLPVEPLYPHIIERHTSHGDLEFICQRCLGTRKVFLPQPVRNVIDLCKLFISGHKDCTAMAPPDFSHLGLVTQTRNVDGWDESFAVFDDVRQHRYMLGRTINPRNPITAVWVMLNPSKADAKGDDPTLRKVKGFAHKLHAPNQTHPGFGRVIVVNLFSLVATNPAMLAKALSARTDAARDHAIGQHNGVVLRAALRKADVVIAAWGGFPSKVAYDEAAGTRALVAQAHPYCLGLTDKGEPRHPLMRSYNTKLVPYGTWSNGVDTPPAYLALDFDR